MDAKALSTKLLELLGLRVAPVAIAFRPSAPPGMKRIPSPQPAGCAYWRLAAEGQVFYTESTDHHGCPVGAHTHGIDLPESVSAELQGMVRTMVDLQYIKMEEVPAIPRRSAPFGVAMYAPLSAAPFEPDLVLVRTTAKQMMWIAEASQSAGIESPAATMGRPTCAILPQSLQSNRTTSSFGCVGNRVYTGLGDDEGYYALPAARLDDLVQKLSVIVEANRKLEGFHRQRAAAPSA